VDGADDNNSSFAQARGRYRAPYQFSNEVIKEFRVTSNGYSAELGRAGGAVFNVVTNSGGNRWHGTSFFYVRDRTFDAQSGLRQQPARRAAAPVRRDIQRPLVKNRVFLYLGYDQHQLTVPSIMQFGNGASDVVPQPTDYDRKDKDLVFAAAAQLNSLAGEYPAEMGGNAGFAKLDFNLSSKQLLFFRLSTARYSGTNNVFFDPASPITTYTEDSNGTEDVKTESVAASWTGIWTNRLSSNLRAQFSRDVQQSFANSDTAKIKIYGIVDGMGRSNILPRETREHKLHVADTISYNNGRMNWKFGGDRISKGFQLSERVRLTLLVESFNVTNRVNGRVDISDDGFLNSAGQFVAYSSQVGKTLYPGEFIKSSPFLIPTNSYAPLQVQFSARASF